MNPIDDFAALRPDVDVPTQGELDQLWDRVLTADNPRAGSQAPSEVTARRRRVAVLGAAASLIVGVAAIALVADRAEAPTGVADTIATPPPESSPSTSSGQPTPAVDLTEPPTWTVTEPGWVSAPPLVSFDPGVAAVTLVAGPEGVAESWVAIVDGVSDPLMSVGGLVADYSQMPIIVVPGLDEVLDPVPTTPARDPSESDEPIIAWRSDPAIGNFIVSAGGVARSDAQAVFTAVHAGTELPQGFTVLPDVSGSLAQRQVTQRFDHFDGRWIEIATKSGGQPRYDVELQRATAAEFFEPPAGIDVADIAFVGEYTLQLRTGFWVSTVRTSASFDAAPDFTDMVKLVELDSEAASMVTTVTTTTDPATTVATADVPPVIARIAIGDSVMLGAAEQLIELGFTVDALESRAFTNGLDLVRTLAEQDRLPETMVVHLGSNEQINELWMSEFIELVEDVDTVILLTSAIDRDYVADNNEMIFDAAAANDNIQVLDWSGLAASCPGDCFEADEIHLKPDGREYYAALVAAVLVEAEA